MVIGSVLVSVSSLLLRCAVVVWWMFALRLDYSVSCGQCKILSALLQTTWYYVFVVDYGLGATFVCEKYKYTLEWTTIIDNKNVGA